MDAEVCAPHTPAQLSSTAPKSVPRPQFSSTAPNSVPRPPTQFHGPQFSYKSIHSRRKKGFLAFDFAPSPLSGPDMACRGPPKPHSNMPKSASFSAVCTRNLGFFA
eukprot:3937260-Rhodomonas_salina.2